MLSSLVGRERELALLLGCLDEAQQGRANLVVCMGEPGVGKSRLVDELAGWAGEKGFLTAWGRAASTDGAPPYWPWQEVLRALEDEGTAGGGAVVDLAVGGVQPSFEARVRTFDAVARLVLSAARSRPLLVVLDDLHGADEPSQLLVQYLARTARDDRLLVVVCCRDTAGPVRDPGPGANAIQVELRGLEQGRRRRAGLRHCRASGQRRRAGCGVRRDGGQPVLRVRARPSTGRGARARGGRAPVRCSTRSASASGSCPRTARRRCVRRRVLGYPVRGTCRRSDDGQQRGRLPHVAGRGGARRAGRRRGRVSGERRFAHDLVRDAIVAGLGTGQRVTLHRRAAEAISAQAPHADGMVFELGAPLVGGGSGRRPCRRGDVDGAGRPRGDAAARLRGRPALVRAGARARRGSAGRRRPGAG